MPAAHRVRDIAVQAGLSEATVDRVLHERPHVSPRARRQVALAVAELERQQSSLLLTGRTVLLDLVMQAPERFAAQVRGALERELPGLRPAVVRARFHVRESTSAANLAAVMDRAVERGSHGILLKAADVPQVAAAVDRAVAAGVPVVTLVTDVRACRRSAYIGIDNAAAGATAAYLVGQWLGEEPGSVLVSVSRGWFRGENERVAGLRAALGRAQPWRPVVTMADTDGLDETMREAVGQVLDADHSVRAVYSCGGGNTGTLAAFAARGRECRVFVAHDLDVDNVALLRRGAVSVVLHHDLDADLRRACQAVLQGLGALPGAPHSLPSPIQVVTPANLPSRLPGRHTAFG